MTPRAAYVHVPFCVHRCGYCDFTVIAGRDDLFESYLSALEIELNSSGAPHEVDTLFIGGGTPTYFPPQELTQFLQLINTCLPLASGGEFSVEANPVGFDAARIDCLMEAGVNRISLGVQSTNPQHLETLERDHSPEDIVRAYELATAQIKNVSLDLIYAVPGQTVEDWSKTLDEVIALSPPHVSTYGLTFEKGTSFWTRREHGTLRPVSEDAELEMYRLGMQRLRDAGYGHYELSNYGRPGFECRHNDVYWQGEEYLGFGPGAAAFVDGVRRQNHRSTTTWIKKTLAGEPAVMSREQLSPEERAREAVMLGLRRRDGIDLDQFFERYGMRVENLEPQAFESHLAAGRLEILDGTLRLTDSGCCVADSVMSDFL